MKKIDEITRKVNKTVGFFTTKQMEILFPIVSKLPPNSLIVEIGTYLGKSAKFFSLANHKARVLTMDLQHFPDVPDRKGQKINQDVLRGGNIFQVLGDSSEIVKGFNWKINVLFIDGSHLYEDVKKDIANWTPFVKVGGFVFLHDYEDTHGGVIKAADEWISNNKTFKTFFRGNGLFIARRFG